MGCFSKLRENKPLFAVVVATIVLVALGALAAVAYVIQDKLLDSEGDAGTDQVSDNTGPCAVVPTDIHFLVDGSGSVNYCPFCDKPNTGFEKELDFVANFVKGSKLGPTRIGLTIFSGSLWKKYAFYMNKYNKDQKNEMIRAIKSIPFKGGGTVTVKALEEARVNAFKKENGGRDRVNNIVILLNDGEGGRSAELKAPQLRAEDFVVFAVGVKADPTLRAHLEKIASAPRYVFPVTDFNALGAEVDNLLKQTCNGAACYSTTEDRILPNCTVEDVVLVQGAVAENDTTKLKDALNKTGIPTKDDELPEILGDLNKTKNAKPDDEILDVVDLQDAADGCTRNGKYHPSGKVCHNGKCTSGPGRDDYTCDCHSGYMGVNCTDDCIDVVNSAVDANNTDLLREALDCLGINKTKLPIGDVLDKLKERKNETDPLKRPDIDDVIAITDGIIERINEDVKADNTTALGEDLPKVPGIKDVRPDDIPDVMKILNKTKSEKTPPELDYNDIKDAADGCIPQPCLNNGTCSSTRVTNFTCDCPRVYSGKDCSIDLIKKVNDDVDNDNKTSLADTLKKLGVVVNATDLDVVMKNLKDKKKEKSPLDLEDILEAAEKRPQAALDETTEGEEKKDWTWLIAGACGLGLLLVVGGCVAFFVMRKKKKKAPEMDAGDDDAAEQDGLSEKSAPEEAEAEEPEAAAEPAAVEQTAPGSVHSSWSGSMGARGASMGRELAKAVGMGGGAESRAPPGYEGYSESGQPSGSRKESRKVSQAASGKNTMRSRSGSHIP